MPSKKKGRGRGRKKSKKKQGQAAAESSGESSGDEAPPSSPAPTPSPVAPSDEDADTVLSPAEKRLIHLLLLDRDGRQPAGSTLLTDATTLGDLDGMLLLEQATSSMIQSFEKSELTFKRWQEEMDRGEFDIASLARSLSAPEYFINYYGRVSKLLLKKMTYELVRLRKEERRRP